MEWVSSRPPARKGYAGTMVLIREGMEAKLTAPKIEAPDTMDHAPLVLEAEI